MRPADDRRFMALAMSLGRRGMGRVWPNPAVGCVIVKEGCIIGRGLTQPGGRPHAETVALEQAGSDARGSTAYVTLEPCAHHGQTPPCAEALVSAGVKRVVAAIEDPDARVAGKGFQILRSAGVEVETGVLAEDASKDLAGFLSRITTNRPILTLKLASTLDGRIATAAGESQWITGPEARRFVHAMRARHDAVLVGGGTARADDPSLTVRGLGIVDQPVRIVASRRLDLPLTGNLARTARDVPVWILHGADVDATRKEAWAGTGADLIEVASAGGQLDPAAICRALGIAGLTRVFCEGGGALAASLLAADLVDELITMTAGFAIGAEGHPAIGALGLETLAEAPRFTLSETRQIGPDAMQVWQHNRG